MPTYSKVKFFKRFGAALFLFMLATAIIIHFFWQRLPYQPLIEQLTLEALHAYGIPVKQLVIAHADTEEALISTIELGEKQTFKATNVKANYDWQNIQDGKLQALEAEHVSIALYQDGNNWKIAGLESLMDANEEAETSVFQPFDPISYDAIPEEITINSFGFTTENQTWNATSELAFSFNRSESVQFDTVIKTLGVKMAPYSASLTGTLSGALEAEAKRWSGEWRLVPLTISGIPLPLPPFEGSGRFQLGKKTFRVDGKLQDSDAHYLAAFSAQYSQNKITVNAKQLQFPVDAYQLNVNEIAMTAYYQPKAKRWKGDVLIPSFDVTGDEIELPQVKVDADFIYGPKQAVLNASFEDKTKSYQGKLTFNLNHNILQMHHIQFPWGKGTVSTKDVAISLDQEQPTRAVITLSQVDLAHLLNEVTDGKVMGTGLISGSIPITYFSDGRITLQEGSLQAEDRGQLRVSPDALPAQEGHLDIARKALQNFEYGLLKLMILTDDANEPQFKLSVEGRNPDLFDGRQINLNVVLSGDVLSLVRQSILPIHDVKQLMKQNKQQ